jgi:hypothetical protein
MHVFLQLDVLQPHASSPLEILEARTDYDLHADENGGASLPVLRQNFLVFSTESSDAIEVLAYHEEHALTGLVCW